MKNGNVNHSVDIGKPKNIPQSVTPSTKKVVEIKNTDKIKNKIPFPSSKKMSVEYKVIYKKLKLANKELEEVNKKIWEGVIK